MVELRPFIVEAIRQEIANQQPKVTEEDIVKIVKRQLEATVIKVVEGAVRSSTETDLLQNQERLGNVKFLPIAFVITLYFSSSVTRNSHMNWRYYG